MDLHERGVHADERQLPVSSRAAQLPRPAVADDDSKSMMLLKRISDRRFFRSVPVPENPETEERISLWTPSRTAQELLPASLYW